MESVNSWWKESEWGRENSYAEKNLTKWNDILWILCRNDFKLKFAFWKCWIGQVSLNSYHCIPCIAKVNEVHVSRRRESNGSNGNSSRYINLFMHNAVKTHAGCQHRNYPNERKGGNLHSKYLRNLGLRSIDIVFRCRNVSSIFQSRKQQKHSMRWK